MRVSIVSDDQQLVHQWVALLRPEDTSQIYNVEHFCAMRASEIETELRIIDVRAFSSQALSTY